MKKIVAVAVLLVMLVIWLCSPGRDLVSEPRAGLSTERDIVAEFRDRIMRDPPRDVSVMFDVQDRDGQVQIAGRVIEIPERYPVGDVEVTFRGLGGETSTVTASDGSYAVRLPPGVYHVFVQDDSVLSVGNADVDETDGRSPTNAQDPDETVMAIVFATRDKTGVDFSVVRGGAIYGQVVDRSGRPIAGATLQAHGQGLRPTLGTDITETDNSGRFELRLPPGEYALDAKHPNFAGLADPHAIPIAIAAGEHVRADLTLTAGCMIAGHVVSQDGKSSGDGAIEQLGNGNNEFSSAGRIEPDGSFQVATTEQADVTIRAWPWMAPPSELRTFACRDGARFDNVVLQIPERQPDLEGELVDQSGRPVAFAFVDLVGLDDDGDAQRERTDGEGHWRAYNLRAGKYRVTAQREWSGVAKTTIESPSKDVRLVLAGTGRIEGTTTTLLDGSFELVPKRCMDDDGPIALPQARFLVTVIDGRFSVEGLPACELTYGVAWNGSETEMHALIPVAGTAHAMIDVGPFPPAKTIDGIVSDESGNPIAAARVTASFRSIFEETTTDASGHYTLDTFPNAQLVVDANGQSTTLRVSTAGLTGERVDILLEQDDYAVPEGESSLGEGEALEQQP